MSRQHTRTTIAFAVVNPFRNDHAAWAAAALPKRQVGGPDHPTVYLSALRPNLHRSSLDLCVEQPQDVQALRARLTRHKIPLRVRAP